MRRAFGFRGLALPALFLLAAYSAACSGSNAAPGAADTSGAVAATSGAAPFGVAVQETYVTIENHTGMPIVGGEVSIISGGVRPPYTMSLPRIENKRKRDFPLRNFRGNDGTEFNRRVARARTVKIVATDGGGKKYQMQVPFK